MSLWEDEKRFKGEAKERQTFQKHIHAEYALWGWFTVQGESVGTIPPQKKGGVENMSLWEDKKLFTVKD